MVDCLLRFDIFSLNETFIYSDNYDYAAFKDYDVHVAKAVRLSLRARSSGGVMVFVNKRLAQFVKRINVKYEHTVVLEINKELFGINNNVFLICMYIHPYDSKFWDISEHGYGIEILEQCIVDLFESIDDEFSLIVCGDLNARTGSDNAVHNDSYDVEWNSMREKVDDSALFQRISDDKETNAFGKELLDLCSMFNCVILNGLQQFDFDDSLTFVSTAGGSTIDYFIVSSDICNSDFVCSLLVMPCIYSSHFPVSLSLCCNNDIDIIDKNDGNEPEWITKTIWDQSLEHTYLENWIRDDIQDVYDQAVAVLDYDVNEALKLFNDALLTASDCMRKRVLVGGGQQRQPALWFDEECRQAKTVARQRLSDFRLSKTDADRELYVQARKQYKSLTKSKKVSYSRNKALQLASLGKNGKLFWKEIKQLSGRKKPMISKEITDLQWFIHFQQLFSGDTIRLDDSERETGPAIVGEENDDTCAELNAAITEPEVLEAIAKLKKGKACGFDGILAEMLKLVDKSAVRFFTKLFNILFDQGIYPDEWTKAIIVPLFKKGDPNSTTNYRGVSLLSLASKCYTSVLNKRLVKWAEENKKITESQAGFRRGYSTMDHIFTLKAIVDKCFAKRGCKLYVCFVDLKLAFDSVQREPLFNILIQNGMNGKFMKAIVAMYQSVLSCVRVFSGRMTDFFECPVGVRQGCILSPEIFSLFINEVARSVEDGGMHGIQLLPGLVELFILLFADDIALLSDTALGLQRQINILNDACKRLFLNVNIDKTKVMVFRKGGFLGKNEKWFLNGRQLEVVNEYTYLGFVFTTKMSLKRGVDALAVKGRRACIDCIRHVRKLNDISKTCFFKIFDAQVQSVLLYSSEMWGLKRLDNIEKVHTLAIKRFLNVPLKVSNKLVYGEVGRYPLYINSAVRCIKYWLKLLKLDISRIPRQAYVMLKNLDEQGKTCWATYVKNTLFSLGFGYVWLQQGVGCENTFVSLFKQRMFDMYLQEWNSSIVSKDIFQNYRLFKKVFESERYFDFVDKKCFRDSLVKLRLGVLPIGASCFRKTFGRDRNSLCKFCNVVEDENHFVLECPLYAHIRTKYIRASTYSYVNILLNGSVFDLRKLSIYLFSALKIHHDFTDNTRSTDD